MKRFRIGISAIIFLVIAVTLCSCGNSGIYNEEAIGFTVLTLTGM